MCLGCANTVHRQRLLDLLEDGAQTRMTLLSAPAGFGKTTLLVGWLASRETARRAAGWVSLDQADNEPAAFWAHFIAAIRGAAKWLAQDLPVLLAADQLPDRATTVGVLNALAALDGEMDVALDDLHLIEGPALFDELAFLIEHLPDSIHLVVSTRADPPLPWRGCGRAGN